MNKYHQPQPKKRGELARESQVAALGTERRTFMAEMGSEQNLGQARTGNVSTRRELSAAKSGLRRQRRLRETGGRSAY